jgi:hypothetical protein
VFLFLTVGVLYVLYTREVPLGESGRFVYRYSKMLQMRLGRGMALVPAMGVLVVAARLLARPGRKWEVWGVMVGGVGMLGLVLWTWWLPPLFLQQHALNLLSPSHEGAFLIEASQVRDMGAYLRGFDEGRLTKSVEEMRGTRVLSNTPGMTVAAWWMMRAWPVSLDEPGVFERYLLEANTRPEDVAAVAYAMKFSVVLVGLWGLSGVFGYLLAREFLSPLGAGLVAVLVLFNPATVNFVPGKDPAQLLTINAMLWCWFRGVRRGSGWWTGGAGALLVIGTAWGLIHIWVAGAALVLRILDCGMRNGKRGFVRDLGSAVVGAIVVLVGVYLLIGWNMVGTFWAVGRRYEEVQHWIKNDRELWFFIGLPLFLLFVSPALYAMVALVRGGWKRWGDLFAVTVGVMGLAYLVGITYELPRLWVAFVPLLTLGAALRMPALRVRDGRRLVGLVVLLIIVNCVATAMHAAALDARESEYRLARPTMFN